MRWWLRKRFRPSIDDKKEKNGISQSAKGLRESEEKLKDAMAESKEIHLISKKSKELIEDRFAKALEQAMRRSHG